MDAAELKAFEIQDLGTIVPKLLEIQAKANAPVKFQAQIELGNGKGASSDAVAERISALL